LAVQRIGGVQRNLISVLTVAQKWFGNRKVRLNDESINRDK